eukprot:390701-Pelagomonas_calceolata.AAC.3
MHMRTACKGTKHDEESARTHRACAACSLAMTAEAWDRIPVKAEAPDALDNNQRLMQRGSTGAQQPPYIFSGVC